MKPFRTILNEQKVKRKEYPDSGASRDKLRKKLESIKTTFIYELNTKLKKNNYKIANRGQLKTLLKKLISKNDYEDFFDLEYNVKTNDTVRLMVRLNKATMKIEIYARNDNTGTWKTSVDDGVFIIDFWNK